MVYTDLLFFLGLMPAAVLLSFLDRSTEYKNLILVLTSLLFIAWGKPVGVLLILLTVISEYGFGLAIEKFRESNRPLASALLEIDLFIDIALLILFAHNYLFSDKSSLSIAENLIPVGAAYYLTRGFSYCWDVYNGRCRAEKNIFCLITFMVSYHNLFGPITRYGETEPQIRHREVTGRCINDGLNRFVIGLAKVVLAASVFNKMKLAGLNGSEITFFGCWLGMISYFAQWYFTIAGLSDMSCGLGRMNGFDYPDNYRPLGVNGLMGGLVRSGNTTVTEFFIECFEHFFGNNKVKNSVLIVICGAALGLWYHIGLNFLICGGAVGLVIALEKYVYGERLKEKNGVVKFIYVLVLSVFIFGGTYFSSLYGYRKWIFALLGVGNDYALGVSLKYSVINNCFILLVSFVSVCTPLKSALFSALDRYAARSARHYGQIEILKTVSRCVLLLLCIITLAAEIAVS